MRFRLPCRLLFAVLWSVAFGQSVCPAGDVEVTKLVKGPTALVVRLGTTDGQAEAELASVDGWVVLGLAFDAKASAKARAMLAEKKLLGRVTILDVVDPKKVPLVGNCAHVLIADLDALGKGAPEEKELMRSVRPLGTLRLKRDGQWKNLTKAWPKEFDDWPMYFHDAAGTDVSSDTAVGPVRGLQWHTGDGATNNKFGLRSQRGVLVAFEESAGDNSKTKTGMLTARDGFTGLKLWERGGLSLTNRYVMLMDEARIYLHNDGDKHMVALDVENGKTVHTFEQGLDLSAINYKSNKQIAELWPQAVLHKGRLIQVGGQRIVVLDAATGKLQWAKDLGEGVAHLPTVYDNTLAVVQGEKSVRSPAYLPGWNCCQLDAVVFYELGSGKELRRWTPEVKPAMYVLHMCAAGGALALAAGNVRSGDKSRDETRVFCLDPDKAGLRWSKATTELGSGGFGGHGGNYRVLIQGGRLWVTALRSAVSYDLKDGGDPKKVEYIVSQCQPTRATTNYHFSALCALRLEDNRLFRSEASRTACDIGPFPSNGLLYSTATNCGCHPFLSGFNAFHSDAEPKPFAGERLQPGSAKPADTSDKACPAADSWPMYMRDPQRSNWSDAKLTAEKLKTAWTTTFADPAAGLPAERAAEWRRTDLSHAPITAPTDAEGVVLLAVPDAHQVIALEPATGKQRWKITVDGRVDSPPTIHRGLVLFGTRNGWVYAVQRDTGELVWRFLAAPLQRQLIAGGQPESVWPVFGTIVIQSGLAWCYAGRSTQLDGGLFWYALEPATGKVVKSGVLSSMEQARTPAGGKGAGYNKITLESPPDTASPFAVTTDGKQMLMARVGLDTASGKMLRAGTDYWFANAALEAHFAGAPITLKEAGLPSCVVPRRFGLLYNGRDEASLYSVSFYGGVLAKLFAYRDGEIIALLSNNPPANRGGGPDGLKRWHTDLIGKPPPPGKEPPAKLIWHATDHPKGNADFPLHQALAKVGDFVLVGHGKKLLVYHYDDGSRAAEYDLPDVPVHNGIAVAAGRVVVCCRDGTVVCLQEK